MSQLELFAMPTEEPTTRGSRFDCLDCGEDTNTIDEYYVVRDAVWREAHPARLGMLCIGCLEGRLGRRLTTADFPEAPLNDPTDLVFGPIGRSRRLLDRLGR